MTFEELRFQQIEPGPGRRKPLGICPRCRTRKSAGIVMTSVREYVPGSGSSPQVRSKSKSLCEECAVGIYLQLEDLLLDEVGYG